jgi:hypothetical protein
MSKVAWLLALIGTAAVAYAAATRTKDASATPEGYLQLKLALYNRSGLAWRIHLRFAPGDESYNYIRAGQVYVGLFRDPELTAQAKALAGRECKKLSAVLARATLAEAELRPEDSGAFLAKLLKGEAPAPDFKSGDSIAKLSISCAEPQGTAWKGEREFKSERELDTEYGSLIKECGLIGDAAAAFAAASTR